MNKLEKINFRQTRDFGETFNVSIKFFRQNFKLFFQSLIFIAGPFILISAITGAFYQSNALSIFSVLKYSNDIFSVFGISYFIFILASVVAQITLLGTVYAYMLTYFEKGPGEFTVNDVARTLVRNIGSIIAVFFVLLLFTVLTIAVFGGIAIGIGAALPYEARAIAAVLLILAMIIGMIILIPPFMWQLSVVYLVKMQEKLTVLKSIGHTFRVMKGNFWWTWLVMVCALIGVGIIGFIFSLPQAIFQMILMYSSIKGGSEGTSIPFLIVATVCTFFHTLLYSALYVISTFHYYSVAEEKDGTGLMDRINEIGNAPASDVEQFY